MLEQILITQIKENVEKNSNKNPNLNKCSECPPFTS